MLGFHRIAPVKTTTPAAHHATENSADCSFAEVQQLGASIKQCLRHGDHCEGCCRVERYLNDLSAQPHLVRLSWYGTSRMNPRVVGQLLDVLGSLVKQIESAKLPQCDAHQQFVAIVAAFGQQHGLEL